MRSYILLAVVAGLLLGQSVHAQQESPKASSLQLNWQKYETTAFASF
jgi:hypothetical protein